MKTSRIIHFAFLHWRKRRQQVLALEYSLGKSRQRAPVLSTQRMPSTTRRGAAQGLKCSPMSRHWGALYTKLSGKWIDRLRQRQPMLVNAPGFFNAAPMRLAFLFLVSFCLIAQSGEGRPQPDASSSDSTAPALRVVFLTPPGVEMPGGAGERLTKIADAADYFYFNGMKHWGYSPGVKTLFRRGQDGLVEILPMKGKKPPDFDGTAEAKFGADVVITKTNSTVIRRAGCPK